MKILKTIVLIIMISALVFNCTKDEKSGDTTETKNKSEGYTETNENKRGSDIKTTSEPLNFVMAGPYALNMILLNTAPYKYKIQMKDTSSDKIITETEASLSRRPLPYYSDHEYFVLLVDPINGETDASGNVANRTFLAFDISKTQFKRYGTIDDGIMNFRVIKNTLYIGNHIVESPNGSLTTIDLNTGKTQYIYQIKAGDELIRIETWAPIIAPNSEGDIVVQIDQYEDSLYRIENNYLIFAQTGSIEEFENPYLPIR